MIIILMSIRSREDNVSTRLKNYHVALPLHAGPIN